MSAELAARRTAAAAVLADYQRAMAGADVADRALWAARLADMLTAVLGALDVPAAGPAEQLEEIRLVLEAFDWETDDRQYALEQIDGIVNRGARQEDRGDGPCCWRAAFGGAGGWWCPEHGDSGAAPGESWRVADWAEPDDEDEAGQ